MSAQHCFRSSASWRPRGEMPWVFASLQIVYSIYHPMNQPSIFTFSKSHLKCRLFPTSFVATSVWRWMGQFTLIRFVTRLNFMLLFRLVGHARDGSYHVVGDHFKSNDIRDLDFFIPVWGSWELSVCSVLNLVAGFESFRDLDASFPNWSGCFALSLTRFYYL